MIKDNGSMLNKGLVNGFRLTQIILLVILLVACTGLMIKTDVYQHVKSNIVEVLCLSCIKLQPRTSADFVFNTMTDEPHPYFILENLTYGPVFLMYSQDVCEACDIMQPVIQGLFNVSYGKYDDFWVRVKMRDSNITYIYINIDHASSEKRASHGLYDKDMVKGVPMFTIVTLGYDHGIVKPYYTSVYGTLNRQTFETRSLFLIELLEQSINMYNQNKEGYHH
jgi:hypothetical protein